MAKIEVKVPDIGDFKDVPIIEILVKPGDAVKAEQSLMTLESDKATIDVPAPQAGVVGEIVAKIGDKVVDGLVAADARTGRRRARGSAGDRAGAGGNRSRRPKPRPSRRRPRPPHGARASAPATPAAAAADFSGVFAGPAARRLARELDIDLNGMRGTGEKGRITRRGRQGGAGARRRRWRAARRCPRFPIVDFAKFGPIETVPLSRIKRISGPRLHASWVNVPHVTHCDEADITDLEAFRKIARRRGQGRQEGALSRLAAAVADEGVASRR